MNIPLKRAAKHLSLILPLLLMCSVASAQPGPLTHLGLRDTVYDRVGNVYQLYDLAVNDTVRGYDTLVINQTCSCDAGYFRLYFEPGCGMEDTTISADTLRRNVLCRVLRDLSQFIQSPLTSNGEKVNIWVRHKDNVPGTSGTTAYGTSFYSIPSVSSVSGIVDNTTWLTIHSGTDGYANIASINPWLKATSSATFFHAVVAFDFDTYTWHTDLSSSPSSGDYDLYSVALREMARILGITSTINSGGNSVLGINHPYFTRYDKYLKTHHGESLLSHTGSNVMYGYQWNSALNIPANILSPYPLSCIDDSTICDTAIQYDGAVTLPVYTPNCFQLGYSLNNFEDMCTGTPDPANNNLYFTVSNVTFPGTLKRYLQSEERKVLCDIGYTLDSVFGDTSILSYKYYESAVCSGYTVAGTNDGLDSFGAPLYFSSTDRKIRFSGPSLAFGIPGILDNDRNADAFEGMEIVAGYGTLNHTSGDGSTDMYYVPATADLETILIRYVPLNTSTGQRGNLTYLELAPTLGTCYTTACDLVVNGNFSDAEHCGVIDVPGGNTEATPPHVAAAAAKICNWSNYAASADLFRHGCDSVFLYNFSGIKPDIPFTYASGWGPVPFYDHDGGTSINFVGMNSGRAAFNVCSSPGWFFEALRTQLAAPLIPGGKYVLDFWARVGTNMLLDVTPFYMYKDIKMLFYVSPTYPILPIYESGLCDSFAFQRAKWSGTDLPLPSLTDSLNGYNILAQLPKTLNVWQHKLDTFTYTGPAALSGTSQFIVLCIDPLRSALAHGIDTSTDIHMYGFVSDVSIKPLITDITPITVCPNDSFNLHPDSLIMASGYGSSTFFDTFAWAPASGLNCTLCPFPNGAVSDTTVYTVHESLYGCERKDTVFTFLPPFVVASADTPCSDGTLHLSSAGTFGVGTLTYSWTGKDGFTSTEANPTRTPAIDSVYTLAVTDSNGCTTTTTVNVIVNELPGPIGGTTSICVGQTVILTNSSSGGTWQSGNTSVATIGSLTGHLTGVMTGTALITYGFGTDCMAVTEVTVNPLPDPITGTLTVCVGGTTTLSSDPAGGAWSSSNASVGTVGSSGIVTGVNAGTTAITYTLSTGCYRVVVVTVNPLPTTITGTLIICATGTTTLTSTSSGGTWESGTTTAATIGSSTGIALGGGAGTSIITYTLPTGCTTTAIITVVAMPDAITGTAEICEGATTTLSNAVPGGVWESSAGGTASVGSLSGIVTGVMAGTATISYTIGGLCSVFIEVTVHPMPSAIVGSSTICEGTTTTYTVAPSGGTWSSSGSGVGSIGSTTGVLLGESAGTISITYTIAGMCSVTKDITVNPSPGMISGTPTVCVMSTTVLSCPGGGEWTTSSPLVATVGSLSGVVTGVGAGTATITYTLSTGCFSVIEVTVYPLPSTISGPSVICVGETGLYSSSPTSGVWSSSIPATGTISAAGALFGASAGTTEITYTLPSGCLRSRTVTVNALPSSITGDMEVCVGATTTLGDATPGGTWLSSNPFIGPIDASGVVTGVSPGTTVISYILSATSCYTTAIVTVHPLPDVILGTLSLCVGATAGLIDATPGGTWSSSDPAIGTIDALTGVWGAVSEGTATITYTLSTGCYSTATVTVLATPGPILGSLAICEFTWATLYDTIPGGGTWSASDVVVIEFFPGADTALIYGSTAGTSIVTYTLPTGCSVTATVTVNPHPDVTGTFAICEGTSTTLSATIPGGTWSASPISVVTISGSGVVSAGLPGAAFVTYTLPTGCKRIIDFTVNQLPAPISGTAEVCMGDTILLVSSPSGGMWTTADMGVATTVPATGEIIGISAGTVIVSYELPSGCIRTTVVTVNTVPSVDPITGGSGLACVGVVDTIDCATPGGTWSTSDPDIVGVGIFAGGVPGAGVYGVSAGTGIITYTVNNECGPGYAFYPVTVIPQPTVSAITGILGVCSGNETYLFADPSPGVWSSSDPAIASVGSLSGVVSGVVTGSVTISYTVTNYCGSITATTNVAVNMEPYITTNFIVACGAYMPPSDGTLPALEIGGECNKVCDSTTVRYYANGVYGSFYWWNVTGGTIVADFGDSIDVFWSTVGLVGSVTLHNSFSHCIDSVTACVKVIEKPHANFSIPSTGFCFGANVVFTDLSTADPSSPIVSWHWIFGDGTGISTPGSAEHIYTTAGDHTVTLVVKNACNCTDTFSASINISAHTGPEIVCPSVVCDSDFITYSTTSTCPSYNWDVSGGTIVSGSGTSAIRVHWNAADSTGYGTVSLATPGCALCDFPTSVKIPIILQSPVILGADIICTNQEYLYQMPLWPATDYAWGVIGEPGAIPTWRRYDYKVGVFFTTPGTYQIHARYQNRISLCGGNIYKTIVVVGPSSVTGPALVCDGATASYSLTGGFSASWELRNPAGTVVASSSGSSFSYTFSGPGTYVLYPTGSFCAEPLTINVKAVPGGVDTLSGEDSVCLHRYYSYHAGPSIDGSVFEWDAVGGDISPRAGADVTVEWTVFGTKILRVRRVSVDNPNCPGEWDSLRVFDDIVTLNLTGSISVCPNSSAIYPSGYSRGEVYDWAVFPNTAGSVTDGNHEPTATILWNNTTAVTTATVVVTVRKCDTVQTDSLQVTINMAPPIYFDSVSNDTVCSGEAITFIATSGGASYRFEFGDGNHVVTGYPYTTYRYPPNHTSAAITYHVSVRATSGSCPPSGIAYTDVIVLPAPDVVLAIHPDTISPCEEDTLLVEATISSSPTITSYAWLGAHAEATSGTYYLYGFEAVALVVTATSGCKDTAAIGRSYVCDTVIPPCTIAATTSTSCNTTILSAGGGAAIGRWYEVVGPSYTLLPGTNPISITHRSAGVFYFQFAENETDCISEKKKVIVKAVPELASAFKCGTSGVDTLRLANRSSVIAGATGVTYTWSDVTSIPATTLSTTYDYTSYLLVAAGTSVTIRIRVTGVYDGVSFDCFVDRVLTAPPLPTVGFSIDTTPTCETVPVNFTPWHTGVAVSHFWDFGDGATLALENGRREFSYGGITGLFPTPDERTVSYTVIDAVGCTANHTELVFVHPNLLNGDVSPDLVICSSAAPITLSYNPLFGTPTPIHFEWSTGEITPTIDVHKSGAFWVTVYDGLRCQQTVPLPPITAVNIKIIEVPEAVIRGPKHYCVFDQYNLNGYAGPGVMYQWIINGTPMPFTSNPALPGFASLPIPFTLQLVNRIQDITSGIYCFESSAVENIFVHAKPITPEITGPTAIDCDLYHLQLIATEPVAGTYNWSNGVYGAVNDVYIGGPYRVWFTNLWGCVNSNDTYVPMSPSTFFPYFPSGCYEICDKQLPITLEGPPYEYFNYWAWLKDHSVALSGSSDTMHSYSITGPGEYNWALGNGICTDTSGPMNVSTSACESCQGVALDAIMLCDSTDPKGYDVAVSFNTTSANTHYVLGTNIGPISPFSGTIPTAGTYTASLTFTTLYTTPLPDSVTVELMLTTEYGGKCYEKITIPLDTCHWIAERFAGNHERELELVDIATALLVFPNPASREVSISYDFGFEIAAQRSVAIFDITGRKLEQTFIESRSGTWKVDTDKWTAGTYIVRMEENGHTLHAQRLLINH
ncbi:MAG: PKD domain-containing protein [Taibaiella sp.]|nr:PKD domain-containing protein [Taibaiella sp.]